MLETISLSQATAGLQTATIGIINKLHLILLCTWSSWYYYLLLLWLVHRMQCNSAVEHQQHWQCFINDILHRFTLFIKNAVSLEHSLNVV